MISDQYSKIPSKAYRWAMRNRAKGLCVRCGRKKDRPDRINCKKCREYMSERGKALARRKGLVPSIPDKRKGSKYDFPQNVANG